MKIKMIACVCLMVTSFMGCCSSPALRDRKSDSVCSAVLEVEFGKFASNPQEIVHDRPVIYLDSPYLKRNDKYLNKYVNKGYEIKPVECWSRLLKKKRHTLEFDSDKAIGIHISDVNYGPFPEGVITKTFDVQNDGRHCIVGYSLFMGDSVGTMKIAVLKLNASEQWLVVHEGTVFIP